MTLSFDLILICLMLFYMSTTLVIENNTLFCGSFERRWVSSIEKKPCSYCFRLKWCALFRAFSFLLFWSPFFYLYRSGFNPYVETLLSRDWLIENFLADGLLSKSRSIVFLESPSLLKVKVIHAIHEGTHEKILQYFNKIENIS